MTLELSTITREPKCETCGTPLAEHTDSCSRHEFVVGKASAPAPPPNGQVAGTPEWPKPIDPKATAERLRKLATWYRHLLRYESPEENVLLLAADALDRLAADRDRLDGEVRALERWAVFPHQGDWYARVSTPLVGHQHRLFEEGVAEVRRLAGINPDGPAGMPAKSSTLSQDEPAGGGTCSDRRDAIASPRAHGDV